MNGARRGWRRLAGPALAMALGIVLPLAILEVVVRLVPSVLPRAMRHIVRASSGDAGVAHPYIGHLHTPHSQTVIAGKDFEAVHDMGDHGFRNPPPWPERSEVVAVGDSVTYGYGVSGREAWPSVLGRALPGVKLVNLGLIGAGPAQYLRVYETFGSPLRPKLLLVGVLPQNDFWDAGLFQRWLDSGEGGNYMKWRDTSRRVKAVAPPGVLDALVWKVYATARHSHLFNLAWHTLGPAKPRLADNRVYQFADGTTVRLYPTDFAEKTAGATRDRPEYRLVVEALAQLDEEARTRGVRVAVVLLPSKEEVYLPLLGIPVADAATDLREALGQRGIDYVNLLPLFRERASAGRRLFFEEDGHPNAEGYALIAAGVLRHLERHAYLDFLPRGRAAESTVAPRDRVDQRPGQTPTSRASIR